MDQTDLQPLLDAVPLPMIHVGSDWRIAALNAPAKTLFGAAALGRHFGLAIRKPTLVDAIETVGRGAPRQVLRVMLTQAEQENRFEVTVAPLPGGGVLASFVDTTEQELVTQFRRDFVANVSHELRTPLTALLGFIETLQGPARDDAAARERFLGIMAREAGRMARLVRDLLSLNRVESQERQRPETRVDLQGLLAGVVATLRPVAQEARVVLELDASDAPEGVRGDGDQLTQVFHNLIENAVKYGGSGGKVSIRVRRLRDPAGIRGQAVEISVIDQGDGIDPQHLPRLTERFYRVDSHRSREKGGTGLGLAIVKHILNRHRGRLRIESEKGKGSSFSVLLPLE
ncbi:ATP-binding protein [Gemmobacter serpentinus]|uniref:ATP-binding protein n=1 Tax=Gemmobacter serpentinus TaxID=2652247 RepID=UPI00124CC0B8|nr:ATP-binding protein [Gemmobacter serpentinus]